MEKCIRRNTDSKLSLRRIDGRVEYEQKSYQAFEM